MVVQHHAYGDLPLLWEMAKLHPSHLYAI